MKQIWPDYSYSPATNVLTLTGLNIDRDQLLLVAAPERGRIIYNFADSSVTASAFTSGANTALTLVASTAGLTTTASLVIYYDDQLQSTAVSISNFPATQPVSIASVTVGNTVTIAGTVTANLDPNASVIASQVENGIAGYAADLANDPLPIYGTVTIGSALPAGTNRIGVVTIGAGTVTIGAGTAQIGSVTASISGTVPVSISSVTVGNSVTIGSLPAISGTVTVGAGTAQIGSVTASIIGTVPVSISSVTVGNSITIGSCVTHGVTIANTSVTVNGTFFQATQPVSLASLPALAAGTAQIGSVTASISNSVTIASLPAISGTVTANLAISSTVITSGSFTSLTSATLVPANPARKMATVYNLGAGQLFIKAGVAATTLGGGFMVALSSGDFYECDYTTTTLSAIFATAGTASWVSH